MGTRSVDRAKLFLLVLLLVLVALPLARAEVFGLIHADQSALYELPAPALTANGLLIDRALLTSISASAAVAAPRQLLSFSTSYQIWQGSDPNEQDQLMFVSSWTPAWPPKQGFYFDIYEGIPPAFPGVSGSAQFSLTAPDTPGTYYLLFVFASNYIYDVAANDFTTPLDLSPGHIEIDVVDANTTTATTSFPIQVTDAISGHGISGASTWLDRIFEGSTDDNGRIRISAAYPAHHSFHVIAHGYEDASGTWLVNWRTDQFAIVLNPIPPQLVPLYVYALPVGYLGQDPADSATHYLDALIMVNYVRDGQAQTTTQITPFTLLADPGSGALFSVVSYPRGWKFTCVWDNYGYRQHYTCTLLLPTQSSGRIAAYFSKIMEGMARIKNFQMSAGIFRSGDLLQFNALIENTGNFRSEFQYRLHVLTHTQTSNDWSDVEIQSNTIFVNAQSVASVAYVWQIPSNSQPGTGGAYLMLQNMLGDQLDKTADSLFMVDTGQSYVEISGRSQIRLIHVHLSSSDMNHLSPILRNGTYFATSAEEFLLLLESSQVFQANDLQTLVEHLPNSVPLYYQQLSFEYQNWLSDGSGGLTLIYEPSNGTVLFYNVPPVFMPRTERLDLANSTNPEPKVLDTIIDQLPSIIQYVSQSTSPSTVAFLNIPDLYSILVLKD